MHFTTSGRHRHDGTEMVGVGGGDLSDSRELNKFRGQDDEIDDRLRPQI